MLSNFKFQVVDFVLKNEARSEHSFWFSCSKHLQLTPYFKCRSWEMLGPEKLAAQIRAPRIIYEFIYIAALMVVSLCVSSSRPELFHLCSIPLFSLYASIVSKESHNATDLEDCR